MSGRPADNSITLVAACTTVARPCDAFACVIGTIPRSKEDVVARICKYIIERAAGSSLSHRVEALQLENRKQRIYYGVGVLLVTAVFVVVTAVYPDPRVRSRLT